MTARTIEVIQHVIGPTFVLSTYFCGDDRDNSTKNIKIYCDFYSILVICLVYHPLTLDCRLAQ